MASASSLYAQTLDLQPFNLWASIRWRWGQLVCVVAFAVWKFEERDRVEREVERGWRRRGRDSGFLRVLGFGEMWGRRGSRGEREWREGGFNSGPGWEGEMNRVFFSSGPVQFFLGRFTIIWTDFFDNLRPVLPFAAFSHFSRIFLVIYSKLFKTCKINKIS